MSQKYKIIFSGVTLFGFDDKQLREESQQLLGLDDEQIEYIFSGEPAVLKSGLSLDDGRQLEKSLKDIGLFIYLEEDNPVVKKKEINLAVKQKVLKKNYQPKRVDDGVSVMLARSRNNLEVEVDAPSFFKPSFEGRYGRLNYLNISWFIYSIAIFCAIVMIFFNITSSYFVIFLIVAFLNTRAVSLRLHDLNKSAWYSLLLLSGLIPYIGGIILFGFTLYLIFARGTVGDNDYGLPSKRGHIIGLILTCISPILLATVLLIYGLPAYQTYIQRLHITNGIQLITDDMKKSVTDYHRIHKDWPNSNYDIGLTLNKEIRDKSDVDDIQITYGGKITIYYNQTFDNGTIIFTPTVSDGQYIWDCYGGTIPLEYRPEICRK